MRGKTEKTHVEEEEEERRVQTKWTRGRISFLLLRNVRVFLIANKLPVLLLLLRNVLLHPADLNA